VVDSFEQIMCISINDRLETFILFFTGDYDSDAFVFEQKII